MRAGMDGTQFHDGNLPPEGEEMIEEYEGRTDDGNGLGGQSNTLSNQKSIKSAKKTGEDGDEEVAADAEDNSLPKYLYRAVASNATREFHANGTEI